MKATLTPTVKLSPKAQVKTTLTPAKMDEVRREIVQKPSTSYRKLASQTDMHPSSAYRASKSLNLNPYRATVVQELKAPDYSRRLEFGRWLNKFIRDNGGISALDNHEAWLHKTGFINVQNLRYWSAENPHKFEESSLH